jgi:hypothetical protein
MVAVKDHTVQSPAPAFHELPGIRDASTILVRQPRGASMFPETSPVETSNVLGSANFAQVIVSRTGIPSRTLLERLKRLEYRGYDSYGVFDGRELRKRIGSIEGRQGLHFQNHLGHGPHPSALQPRWQGVHRTGSHPDRRRVVPDRQEHPRDPLEAGVGRNRSRAARSRNHPAGRSILQIMIIDIVFSLDSVISAVGLAQDVMVMIIAIISAVLVMMVASKAIGDFVDRHPTIKILATLLRPSQDG